VRNSKGPAAVERYRTEDIDISGKAPSPLLNVRYLGNINIPPNGWTWPPVSVDAVMQQHVARRSPASLIDPKETDSPAGTSHSNPTKRSFIQRLPRYHSTATWAVRGANERRKKAVAASSLLYVIEHFHVHLPAILQ
jgi:hypothetical protein